MNDRFCKLNACYETLKPDEHLEDPTELCGIALKIIRGWEPCSQRIELILFKCYGVRTRAPDKF